MLIDGGAARGIAGGIGLDLRQRAAGVSPPDRRDQPVLRGDGHVRPRGHAEDREQQQEREKDSPRIETAMSFVSHTEVAQAKDFGLFFGD